MHTAMRRRHHAACFIVPPHVLKKLSREAKTDEARDAIIETIKQRSAGTFDLPEGTVYPALHRLEQAGLLSSAWTPPPNGRRRRVYSLTRAGSAALGQRRRAWGRFSQAVDTALAGGRG